MESVAAEEAASKPLHAVVCGGGVIGACTAFYLAEKGVKVTVVEKCHVACAASGKAGGFLALDWCSGPTGKLAQLSYRLHEQLAQQFGDCYGYRKVHTLSLQVAEPKNSSGGQRTKNSTLPGWIDGPVRGVQTMGSPVTTAQVHPQLFTETLLRVAGERHGVEVQLGEVQEVAVAPVGDAAASSKVTGVIVDGATVPADIVLFALGPWSGKNRLIARLGQITGLKANSVVTQKFTPGHRGKFTSVVTEGDNYLPDNPEEITTTPGVPEFLKRVGATVSSALSDVTIVKEQACFLPCSQDNVPVIGAVPGMQGAYIATGHTCWGILNAPATGLAVAELAVDGRASCVDLRPFDPASLGGPHSPTASLRSASLSVLPFKCPPVAFLSLSRSPWLHSSPPCSAQAGATAEDLHFFQQLGEALLRAQTRYCLVEPPLPAWGEERGRGGGKGGRWGERGKRGGEGRRGRERGGEVAARPSEYLHGWAHGDGRTGMGARGWAHGDGRTGMGARGWAHGDGRTGMGAWGWAHGDGRTGMGARGWAHGDGRTGMGAWGWAHGDGRTGMGAWGWAHGDGRRGMREKVGAALIECALIRCALIAPHLVVRHLRP
ncbi:unnamed protein product [Closterium sp. Naga37s-1]|nr:unnamed protein product [Closterium sp. Naga37s-1]